MLNKAGKKYTKLMIFLFFLFVIVTLVLVSDLFKITDRGLDIIDEKKKDLNCINLNYEVRDKTYVNQKLSFEVVSIDYDTNISSITVMSDNSNNSYSYTFTPPLMGGESKMVLIPDINLTAKFLIYAEKCHTRVKNESI